MRRKLFILVAIVVLVLGALLAYVLVPVTGDLRAVRKTLLAKPVDDLEAKDVATAAGRLKSAHERLSSPAGRVLGWVPVVGANLDAVDAVSQRLIPVLNAGLDLKERVDELAEGGLIEEGRVEIDRFRELLGPLDKEIAALNRLTEALTDHRSGSLAPPLWSALDDLKFKSQEFLQNARELRGLLGAVGSLLGENEPRTYLVLLINNAELRGAGGILAGVGTLDVDDGKLNLGRFQSVHELQPDPPKKVESPADFRRFEKYGANSVFLNSTYSPDTVDDAVVSARLYELVTGISADGAIVIDPRGLADLLPPDSALPAPGSSGTLSPAELPRFVYAGAYEQFGNQEARRDALLKIGERAFRLIIDAGLRGERALREAGSAIAAGHVRVVAFDPDEASALDDVGASGDLPEGSTDSVLVAAQNRGGGVRSGFGSKMDYWAERVVSHRCSVDTDRAACTTAATLRNIAPQGLNPYVTGFSRPYGLLRSLFEIYVPADAEEIEVEQDGRPARFFEEEQADRVVIGTYVEAAPDEEVSVRVGYQIPIADEYSLVATPQPLARDARIEITLALPSDWEARGPGALEDDVYSYSGAFESSLSITARPDERTGIPALWDALTDFWREPLF